MKPYLAICLSLLFLGCTAENAVENTCSKFLATHPSVSEKHVGARCLNDSTLFYDVDFTEGYAVLAGIDKDSMRTKGVFCYSCFDFSVKSTADLRDSAQSAESSYTKAQKDSTKNDSTYKCSGPCSESFEKFKAFAMDVYGFSDDEFEREYYSKDYLLQLYTEMRLMLLFGGESPSIERRNDSTFYVKNGLDGGSLSIANVRGGVERKVMHFSFSNCCGAHRWNSLEYSEGTDSSYFAKFKNGNWIRYDESRDSVTYFTKDSLDWVYIEHYRTRGDTMRYIRHESDRPCPVEYNCVS